MAFSPLLLASVYHETSEKREREGGRGGNFCKREVSACERKDGTPETRENIRCLRIGEDNGVGVRVKRLKCFRRKLFCYNLTNFSSIVMLQLRNVKRKLFRKTNNLSIRIWKRMKITISAEKFRISLDAFILGFRKQGDRIR